MTTYEHICNGCKHEWEDVYGMTEDPPTTCPECKEEGKVQRLISGGSGKGIVEVTGHDLKAKLKAEGQQLKRDALKNENVLANLVGEHKYQNNTVQLEKSRTERPKIQTKRKSER